MSPHLQLTLTLIGITLAVGFDALCLMDIAQQPDVRGMPREAWAVLCIITTPLGGLLYLRYGRPPGPARRA